MRKVKFKAYNKKTKQMLESKSLYRLSQKEDGIFAVEGSIDRQVAAIFHGDLALMQYTGLKDKEGVEIYEGDIVRFSGTVRDTAVCLVEFHEGRFIFRLDKHTYRDVAGWRDYEIIGNLHENPELLTK